MLRRIEKTKRGELATQHIVIVIILILSFIVILILLWKLGLGQITDKEICRNSVVSRGNSLLKSLSLSPIDCRTNYVCVSGGGKCKDIVPTTTIKVDPNNREEIMKVIADEMADCWWMFGEGKVDYMGIAALENRKVCAMCSIIAFDEEIQNKNKHPTTGKVLGVNYLQLYQNYLTHNNPENKKESYLKYLYDVYDVNDLDKNFREKFLFTIDPVTKEPNKISFDKQYFVLTGMAKRGAFLSISIYLSLLVGGEHGFVNPVILEKTSDNFEKLGCTEFITKA